MELDQQAIARIRDSAAYQTLVKKRTRFAWTLTAITLVVYYGYVAAIAFDKPLLARPIGDGVTSLGIPVGLGVIVVSIVLTAIYVHRANAEFDRLTRQIAEEASK